MAVLAGRAFRPIDEGPRPDLLRPTCSGLFKGAEWQEQRHRPADKRLEAFTLVERDGVVVDCIDDQRKSLRIAGEDAEPSVSEQCAAKAPAVEILVDREATDEGGRQNGITRKAL